MVAGLFDAYPLIAGLFDAYPKVNSTKMIAGLFDAYSLLEIGTYKLSSVVPKKNQDEQGFVLVLGLELSIKLTFLESLFGVNLLHLCLLQGYKPITTTTAWERRE